MSQYRELFSIHYRHEYFARAGSLSMKCLVSVETRRLFHNMNVIMKPFQSGCKLLYDEERHKTARQLLSLFLDENLIFILYPEDSQGFYNYTSGFGAEKAGVLLFSADKAVDIEDNRVNPGPGEFVYSDHSKYTADEIAGLTADEAAKITADEIAEFTPDEFAEFRAGRNRQIPVVYKVTTNRLLALPEASQHQLSFKSFKTYYKYYVCDATGIDGLQMIDVDKEIEFTQSQERLENGKPVQVFLSTGPVAPLYQAKRHFQLMEMGSGARRLIKDYMPMPEPGHYFTELVDGERVVISEVFIN